MCVSAAAAVQAVCAAVGQHRICVAWVQAEDAQLLMAALQGVVAKQFGVLVDAIKQLQQREGPTPSRQLGGPALRQAAPSSGPRT
jgi:hypothetical protein